MITGTSYFRSFAAACLYYSAYEEEMKIGEVISFVSEKIEDGDIMVGEPDISDEEELILIDDNTRYAIKERKL